MSPKTEDWLRGLVGADTWESGTGGTSVLVTRSGTSTPVSLLCNHHHPLMFQEGKGLF